MLGERPSASITRDEVVPCQTAQPTRQQQVRRAVAILDGVASDDGAAADDGHGRSIELHDIASLLRPNRLLQHIAEIDRRRATYGGIVGPIRVHGRRVFRVVIRVAVTGCEMALQEIRAGERVLHLSDHDRAVADADHRLAAFDERFEEHPVSRVVPEVANRSAAAYPGHASELIQRLQIRFESRRKIISNVLALLWPQPTVANEVAQARRVLQEPGVFVNRIQLGRNGWKRARICGGVTLRNGGIARVVISITLSGREKLPAQSRNPFGDLQRVQRLI
ncbi:MAG: chorismate-binding protein, partial [Candidatus Competibacter sp.]|nr:chorismate-binding protein [Candidatus Competibacter sp.]